MHVFVHMFCNLNGLIRCAAAEIFIEECSGISHLFLHYLTVTKAGVNL
jgi:hypothetical protein